MDGFNLVFDVVNSVKGGCGKSTFSVLLAASYSMKGEYACVIDLDVSGSSLYDTYKGNLKLEKGSHIEDFLWDVETNAVPGSFEVEKKSGESGTVDMFVVGKKINYELDELQLDLFEDAIYRIIVKICELKQAKQEVHIIFDMPPGYEKHAERIVKWLLLKTQSKLASFQKDYHVNLFMISAFSQAHMNANNSYFDSFFDGGYSSKVLASEIRKILTVYPVFNDVTDASTLGESTKIREERNSCLETLIKKISPIMGANSIKYLLINHCSEWAGADFLSSSTSAKLKRVLPDELLFAVDNYQEYYSTGLSGGKS